MLTAFSRYLEPECPGSTASAVGASRIFEWAGASLASPGGSSQDVPAGGDRAFSVLNHARSPVNSCGHEHCPSSKS